MSPIGYSEEPLKRQNLKFETGATPVLRSRARCHNAPNTYLPRKQSEPECAPPPHVGGYGYVYRAVTAGRGQSLTNFRASLTNTSPVRSPRLVREMYS